jgi:hypothetical protein
MMSLFPSSLSPCVSLLTAKGGKLPATKGVILRQVRCRLLPFFVARFRAAFFPNDFVRGWCLSKKSLSLWFISTPFYGWRERRQLPP